MGLLSNYCGLGGSGIPQHAVDRICRRHDRMYKEMIEAGYNPYLQWNHADEWMQDALREQVPHGFRQVVLSTSAANLWAFKRALAPSLGYDYNQGTELEEEFKDEEYTIEHTPSMDVEMADTESTGPHVFRFEAQAGKRKKREEHGMEPQGHGNTPATGTEQKGYIEKYVPVNFPNKMVLKQKYIQSLYCRSITTAAGIATPFYQLFRMNDVFAPNGGSAGVLSQGHKPNQKANWAAQYGYYRVESLDYKFTCIATSNASVTTTANPPGAFVNPQFIMAAILTLQKTLQSSDVTATSNTAKWEQKISNNVVLSQAGEAGSPHGVGPSHIFAGTIDPEDYDMDVTTTAQDETWTLVGASPAVPRYLAISGEPMNPTNTVALLPEIGVMIFAELTFTVQYAGYAAGLRQTTS